MIANRYGPDKGRVERRWTIRELAERAGVSANALRRVRNGDLTVSSHPGVAITAASGDSGYGAEFPAIHGSESEPRLVQAPGTRYGT